MLGLEIAGVSVSLDVQTTVAVYVNDNPIDPLLISKVGFVPGQPGIYQLTVQIPLDTPANPEVRVEANGFKSPAGFKVLLVPQGLGGGDLGGGASRPQRRDQRHGKGRGSDPDAVVPDGGQSGRS